jgi:acyl-CoA hydrolase
LIKVTPPDQHGYVNLGTSNSITHAFCDAAKIVIAEVNSSVPRCLGGLRETLHVSEIDYFVQGDNRPLINLSELPISDIDKKIATIILEQIGDGACLQLGIGAMPNAVGAMIAQSDLQDLGVHTEMLVDSFVDMYEAGRISGLRKQLDKGKMVYTFAMGTKKLYDFLDNNPICASFPVSYTNDPDTICQNDNMICINNAIEVDLYGQVASESSGIRQISGTGGQLDFIYGSYKSKGGKGLICLTSTFVDDKGQIQSRIKPILTPGAIVTVPRSINFYVVTEYGVAMLKGKSSWERAEALINIAHPDLRDELIKEADANKIWVKTNKIRD